MSGLFVGLLKARRAFAPNICVQQRATYIHGKPPKQKISVMVSLSSSLLIRGFRLILHSFHAFNFADLSLICTLQESVFVMTVLTLAILGPSGWILSQIEHYKKRD